MIDAHAALRSSRRDLLLPLMVGATGHRDLDPDAVPDLTAKVHEIFLELRRNSPYTPIVVMSGLAEGADRLIARAALAAGIDAELIAVLPMDRETYIHDFETPESIAEFDTLIGWAREMIRLDRSLHGGSINSDPGNDARMLAYQRLGRFLASRCHVMVALWDGERGQPGDTAEVVDRMLTRGSASDSGDGAAKTFNVAGPVFQIVTPRLRHAMRRPVERCDLLPQNDEFEAESPADSCRRHIFAPLERFNREVCALEAAEFAEIEASERDL